MNNKLFLLFVLLFLSTKSISGVKFSTCFTPGQNCTQFIINAIDQAKSNIYMQAYSFTSTPIADALIRAKKRGIKVNVILDKSQFSKNKYVVTSYLINNEITVYDDSKPQIAHNKIIIIDGNQVLTGSFNYTHNAQIHNAENIILINDEELAQIYLKYWQSRLKQSH